MRRFWLLAIYTIRGQSQRCCPTSCSEATSFSSRRSSAQPALLQVVTPCFARNHCSSFDFRTQRLKHITQIISGQKHRPYHRSLLSDPLPSPIEVLQFSNVIPNRREAAMRNLLSHLPQRKRSRSRGTCCFDLIQPLFPWSRFPTYYYFGSRPVTSAQNPPKHSSNPTQWHKSRQRRNRR